MTNRKMILMVLVGLAAVGLVVAALAFNAENPWGRDDSEIASAQDGSESADPSTDPVTGADADAPSSVGSSNGDEDQAAKEDSSVDAESAPSIAEPGEALVQITTPPPETLAMLSSDRLPAGTAFDIAFKPYGTGPGTEDSSLVITVTESKAQDAEAAKDLDLVGKNMLVALTVETAVPEGGAYRGVITFVAKGDVLVPELSAVRPASE